MFTEVNITVLGLTNPDVNLKRMHQFYYVNWVIEYVRFRLWDYAIAKLTMH